jgi:hypothetical protein
LWCADFMPVDAALGGAGEGPRVMVGASVGSFDLTRLRNRRGGVRVESSCGAVV